jgi:phosphate:Na+ symporter
MDLSDHDLNILGSLHHVIIDLERVGDLAENIAGYASAVKENKTKFSVEGYAEMKKMSEKALEALATGLDVFEKRDKNRVALVSKLEQEVDNMKRDYIQNHVDRLQVKACDPQSGVIFTNLIATLERVADHANNITYTIKSDS